MNRIVMALLAALFAASLTACFPVFVPDGERGHGRERDREGEREHDRGHEHERGRDYR